MMIGAPPGPETVSSLPIAGPLPEASRAQSVADEPGGFWRRLFSFVVDAAVVWLLLRAGGLLRLLLARRPLVAEAFGLAWLLVVPAAYFVVLHGTGGQTLGKRIFGVRVVRLDGEPVGYARALLRLVGWIVSALVLFIGHLVVPARADRRALYDHLAGTRVVRIRRDASVIMRPR